MQVRTVTAHRGFAGIDSFSVVSDDVPVRLRGRRRGPGASLRVLACAGMVLGLAAMVADFMARPAGPEAPPAGPAVSEAAPALPAKPVWVEVNRPIQLYDLAGTDFGKLPLTYRARRLSDDTVRQDLLAFGHFDDDLPSLTLAVQRGTPSDEASGSGGSLLVDLARLAADAGLAVTRSGVASRLPTRFGTFSTSDIIVARAAETASCLGFRLDSAAGDASPVGIAGFACGGSKAMDRSALACVLDRIDLVSAGDDAAVQAFFVEAERRRGGQGCTGSHLLSSGARSSWLDADGQAPSLRRLAGGSGRIR